MLSFVKRTFQFMLLWHTLYSSLQIEKKKKKTSDGNMETDVIDKRFRKPKIPPKADKKSK